jgi:thioredoxin 1
LEPLQNLKKERGEMNKKTLIILIIVLATLAGAVTGVILIKKNRSQPSKDIVADTMNKDTLSVALRDTVQAEDILGVRKDTVLPKPQVPPQDSSSAKEVEPTASDPISRAKAFGRPVLVDFGRGTCIPCKNMAPILAELKEEYAGRVEVLVLDLDEYYELARSVEIRMIPTQIFYDTKGEEVARHIGFMEKDSIIAQFARMGIK